MEVLKRLFEQRFHSPVEREEPLQGELGGSGRISAHLTRAFDDPRVIAGQGTIAFELLLAIVATSMLRHRIGARTWRAVHWLAYACWPVAVLHGIGTGTDSSATWMIAIDVVCVAAVLLALAWRAFAAPPDPLAGERRDAAERASFGAGR